MSYTRTDHYEKIIQRHIRSGRASNKIYQATVCEVAIRRVLYGNINWREEPERLF